MIQKSCLAAAGIAALFALTLLAPRSFCVVLCLTGLAGYACTVWRERSVRLHDGTLYALLLGITVFGAFSTLWAINPEDTLHRALSVSGLFLAGVLLLEFTGKLAPGPSHACIVKAMGIAYGLSALFVSSEYLFGFPVMNALSDAPYPSYGMNRTTVAMMLFFLPLSAALWQNLKAPRTRLAAIALLGALTLYPLSQTQSQSAQLGFVIAIFAFLCVHFITQPRLRRIAVRAMAVLMITATLSMPVLAPALMEKAEKAMTERTGFLQAANALNRLEIWDYAAGFILEKPFSGYGLEAMPHFISDAPLPHNGETSFLHPHNAPLQLWLEMGIIGGLFGALLIALVARRIIQAPYAHQPLYAATFAGLFFILFITYGLWQSWLIGLIFILAAFTRFTGRMYENPSPSL